MTNSMKYGKYVATVELDAEAGLFHGEIINLSDVVTFQGRSIDELRQAFKESVEDYLEACASSERNPKSPLRDNLSFGYGPMCTGRLLWPQRSRTKA